MLDFFKFLIDENYYLKKHRKRAERMCRSVSTERLLECGHKSYDLHEGISEVFYKELVRRIEQKKK